LWEGGTLHLLGYIWINAGLSLLRRRPGGTVGNVGANRKAIADADSEIVDVSKYIPSFGTRVYGDG
jgi:hypothetical protein